jgi:hypothetical protein
MSTRATKEQPKWMLCSIALIEILVTREVEALILLLVDKLDIHMALQVSSHLIY